jgi:hypothetical protein
MVTGQIFRGSFGDVRLDTRGNSLIKDLWVRGSQCIRQVAGSYAEQKAYYRFFENERTSEEAITQSMAMRCGSAVKSRMVLVFQDTTEINLYKHRHRLKQDDSIGLTNASAGGLGFLLHPSLVVDALNCFPYGYCHVHLYNRGMEREADKHRYKQLGIEEKESYKWVASSLQAKEVLEQAALKVIIQDREGDIYEQFATIPDKKTDLLIRAKSNRNLGKGEKLFSKVAACKVAGTYSILVDGDRRKKRNKREVELEVRFTEVELKNASRTAKEIAPTVKLWCVEAKQAGGTKAKQAVCWRLLTTIPVTRFEHALMVIDWYSRRWMIEEVFRILKKEGYNVEGSELGSGTSVKKLCLLTLDAIIKLFQMSIAYAADEEEGIPETVCFTKEQAQCLHNQNSKLEGRTEKQRNPYRQGSLRYATWIIARLGGWKGYASERKPGITTLWIGIERFYNIFKGWKLARDVYTR